MCVYNETPHRPHFWLMVVYLHVANSFVCLGGKFWQRNMADGAVNIILEQTAVAAPE